MKRYIDKKIFKNSGVGGDGNNAKSNTIFVRL